MTQVVLPFLVHRIRHFYFVAQCIFVVVSPFVIAYIHFFFFQLQYLFMQFLHERSR